MRATPTVILLAGGRSQRMGPRNKLLLRLGDKTIIEHAVSAAVRSNVGPVVVVLGSESDQIAKALKRRAIRTVYNAEFEEGMASSIRAGVQAAGADAGGFAICPGDLPGIRTSTFRALAQALSVHRDGIILPVYGDRFGHPVLFANRYFRSLLELSGDAGGRSIIDHEPEAVVRVPVSDPGIHRDVDTEEDWKRLNRLRFED